MSTIRLTIALSAFLVHVEAHACLPVKPRTHLQNFTSSLSSIVDNC